MRSWHAYHKGRLQNLCHYRTHLHAIYNHSDIMGFLLQNVLNLENRELLGGVKINYLKKVLTANQTGLNFLGRNCLEPL